MYLETQIAFVRTEPIQVSKFFLARRTTDKINKQL